MLGIQFVLMFILGRNWVPALRWFGYALWVAAAVLGWLPIIILKRRGGVAPGRSYVRTSRLVTTGLYAVVRHPQYLAGILLGLGLSLVAQHWAVVLLGVVVSLSSYLSTFDEERDLRERFGAAREGQLELLWLSESPELPQAMSWRSKAAKIAAAWGVPLLRSPSSSSS